MKMELRSRAVWSSTQERSTKDRGYLELLAAGMFNRISLATCHPSLARFHPTGHDSHNLGHFDGRDWISRPGGDVFAPTCQAATGNGRWSF